MAKLFTAEVIHCSSKMLTHFWNPRNQHTLPQPAKLMYISSVTTLRDGKIVEENPAEKETAELIAGQKIAAISSAFFFKAKL